MLAICERSLWDEILPLARQRARGGDWDAGRFVVQVLRDPLLGGVARGARSKSAQARAREMLNRTPPAPAPGSTPRVAPDGGSPAKPTSWDPVPDLEEKGAGGDEGESGE